MITDRESVSTVKLLWRQGYGIEDIAVAIFGRSTARTVEEVRHLIARLRSAGWAA